jgi:hypothetical protein
VSRSTQPVTFRSAAPSRPTLLVLRDGRVYMANEYWVDNGKLTYRTGRETHAVSLDAVDMLFTKQLNAERGIPFVLAAQPR